MPREASPPWAVVLCAAFPLRPTFTPSTVIITGSCPGATVADSANPSTVAAAT